MKRVCERCSPVTTLGDRTAEKRGRKQEVSMTMFLKMMKNESGAAAAEYALIIAIIGSVMGLAAIALSGSITSSITGAQSEIATVQAAS